MELDARWWVILQCLRLPCTTTRFYVTSAGSREPVIGRKSTRDIYHPRTRLPMPFTASCELQKRSVLGGDEGSLL